MCGFSFWILMSVVGFYALFFGENGKETESKSLDPP